LRRLGDGATERAFPEQPVALAAMHALKLVGDALSLSQHVARHLRVTVGRPERQWLSHFTHGNCGLGKYDAKMGEEVVTRRKTSAVALAALTVVLAAGCGSHGKRAVPPPPKHRCQAGAVKPLGSAARAYTAAVRTSTQAYRRPGAGPIGRFLHYNVNGVSTVFSVRAAVLRRDCRAAWYRVQLPVKPNGRVGYVRAAQVNLGVVRTRITVDLSRKLLTYYRDGRPRLRLRVGIGSPATPTPTGSFYVNQSFHEDPSGPYGPAAIGISAYSTVLTWWAQGGPVAIHGTNRPWTIGRAASNGCIHVPNPVVRRLFRITPAGTPVVIKA
jgi:lipoprotein-anchoring transpeptidase ErfK/SrfK